VICTWSANAKSPKIFFIKRSYGMENSLSKVTGSTFLHFHKHKARVTVRRTNKGSLLVYRLRLGVMRELAYACNLMSYAVGSLPPGRVTQAGQVNG